MLLFQWIRLLADAYTFDTVAHPKKVALFFFSTSEKITKKKKWMRKENKESRQNQDNVRKDASQSHLLLNVELLPVLSVQ